MFHDARYECGQQVVTEVYGLFSALIPQAGQAQLARLSARKRHGLVPDFLMRLKLPDMPLTEYLLELKGMHLSATRYRANDNLQPGETKAAVKRRSEQIAREYIAKAQKCDQKYCGTAPDDVGPVEERLRSYERVWPLVFGAFGETNDEVERLMHVLAEAGAEKHWRRMKARSAEEAKGAFAWLLRRRWGITALRENARLRLDRLQYLGAGARGGDQRAAASFANAERRSQARADALEFSSFGPSTVGDTRPAAVTRWH